jgi:hypothetical protein
MTTDDFTYLTQACLRPGMFYPSASSFREMFAFLCGTQFGPGRWYGDFGDFPEFIDRRFPSAEPVLWTEKVLQAFSKLDLFEGCEQFRQLLIEWKTQHSGHEESGHDTVTSP